MIAALALGALVLGVLPSAAGAATFEVDSLTDESDDLAGDGSCLTAGFECTLRAAIEEANAFSGTDEILFDQGAGLFDGTVAVSTITIANPLSITERVRVEGGDCTLGAVPKPCAAVKAAGAPFGPDALVFATGSGSSTVRRLAIYNAGRAITIADGVSSVKVEGNWFGMDLDESAGTSNDNQNGTGVHAVGNSADIGGTTAAERNVFRANSGRAVALAGGDTSTVAGNYFGTDSAGTPAAATSGAGGGVEAYSVATVGDGNADLNTIGGSGTGLAQDCDGACNLFALANSSTPIIDLQPPANVESRFTVIKGNFIGLGPTGAETNPGLGTGIAVGNASLMTIGGVAATDRNYIGGGNVGITVGAGSENIGIVNNYIGVQPDGDGQVAPASAGVAMAAEVLSFGSPSISGNVIAGDGTAGQDGLRLTGNDADVKNNLIGQDAIGNDRPFGGDAIEISGVQNTIEANGIRGGTTSGIRIDGGGDPNGGGNANTIISNTLEYNAFGTDTPGILIERQARFNEIGSEDDDPLEQNGIYNSGGDAIEVRGDGTDFNGIYSDVGGTNGGSFIDLNADGPGNPSTGPNAGIGAPVILAATLTQANGTALPGSTIRLFRNALAGQPGAQGDLAGQAVANGSGAWQITYAAVPEGTPYLATQTDTSENTSERSAEVVVDVTAPPAPLGLTTNPASPANNNQPLVRGSAEAGSTVGVYTNATCAGLPAAGGTAVQFASPGIAVSVADNSTTPLSARAADSGGNVGPCSASISYVEDSTILPPAPPAAPAPVTATAKKCKKKKSKKAAAAKKGCKKKPKR